MVEGPLSPNVAVEVAQHSDPGRDPNKQINEDSCGHAKTKFGHLCVLCDGMGGHYGGQEASRRAITTIFEQIEKAPAHIPPSLALKLAIEEAGRRVYELGGPPDNRVRPGSTVVAMLIHDSGVDVAHVGDSRAYVVRANQIYPLTRDHSMVQSMIDAGFLTEEQAIGHPDANKITRALGMKPEVDVEVRPEPMELFPGDLLLQSSDGLTDLALGHEILGALRQALNAGNVDFACQQLVRMANDRGGHDNITVQIARILSTAPKATRAGHTNVPASLGPGLAATAPLARPLAVTAPSAGGHTTVPEGEPSFSSLDTVAMGPESQRPKNTIPMQGGSQPAGSPAHAAHGGGVSPTTHDAPPIAPAFGPPPGPGAVTHAHPSHPSGQMAGSAVSPTIGSSEVHNTPSPQALATFRMDGPHGLALPPPASARFGGFPPGGATPPMTPAPLPYGPNGQAQFGAGSPGGVQQTPWSGGDMGPMSSPSSQTTNRNVLFLWLGASFFVATAVLIIVYVLALR